MLRPRLTLEQYESGIRAGDRTVLAQAITLVESQHASDRRLAQVLLSSVMPLTGKSRRVGITGVPGVGKSTFIDALGMLLLGQGKRVAVLAVDPTSSLSGGSILGDKTRMARLSVEPRAFIRPSPSGLSLGGVARRSRETLLLCEAAGFDVVLVETVGVGQSETAVASMVDFFLVLLLPGAGDELQGIKKGILELADAIAINKADAENAVRAQLALSEIQSALRYVPQKTAAWKTRAVAVSGKTGQGLAALWEMIEEHHAVLEGSAALVALRAEQQRQWMWTLIIEQLEQSFREHPQVSARLSRIEAEVFAGRLGPSAAADELLQCFLSGRR